ncbi:hypothetical protein [Actinomadura flavalba]|uniref:hypothetical protein n=1 Tax=Actinomadura flavalba TaxID=1120938 RepID=UPI0003A957B7|nr:hypothetical protein [Actinomadura flavalba]
MRPGGDHEPDDYGLPPVDVVVPDDARELAGDVTAYHRERKRERRRTRLRRLLRPATRFGLAVPVITLALLVAIVSGTLLTMLGSRSAPRPAGPLLNPSPTARPGEVGGLLPRGNVAVVNDGRRARALADLRPGIIAVAGPGCRCRAVVAELATRARENRLTLWLVADTRGRTVSHVQVRDELRALAGDGPGEPPHFVEDNSGLLARTYAPAEGTRDAGLTAVLVRADGTVTEVRPAARLDAELTEKIKVLR